MSLFLIPIVSGIPIYLVAGIVVVQKCLSEGMSFTAGVTIASLLGLSIKFASNILLMKAIGERYSDNVSVRMTVGTHTPTMKAAEKVLMLNGLAISKVAVLVGSPDWPTAVLCGLLKIPVSSMLIGTSPVFFLIVPVVLSAAYMLLSAQAGEGTELANYYSFLSTILVVCSGVTQMGAMVIAGIYLQAVKSEHQEEFETVLEGDRPVVEAVEAADREREAFRLKTSWRFVPCVLRLILFIGSFSAFFMMHIVMEYAAPAFRDFTLTDKIWCHPKDTECQCDLPGCSPFNVFVDRGWAALAFLCTAIVCKTFFDIWCSCAAKKEDLQPVE